MSVTAGHNGQRCRPDGTAWGCSTAIANPMHTYVPSIELSIGILNTMHSIVPTLECCAVYVFCRQLQQKAIDYRRAVMICPMRSWNIFLWTIRLLSRLWRYLGQGTASAEHLRGWRKIRVKLCRIPLCCNNNRISSCGKQRLDCRARYIISCRCATLPRNIFRKTALLQYGFVYEGAHALCLLELSQAPPPLAVSKHLSAVPSAVAHMQ